MIKGILGILAITICFGSCSSTQNTAQSGEGLASNEPCDIAMGVKFPNGEAEYELIGTCESKEFAEPNLRGGPKGNLAMEEIKKCACELGGDFLMIISHTEKSSHTYNPLQKDLNKRKLSSDALVGEVYVKK